MNHRNSTIKVKNCKCSPDCKLLPSFGCSGFNYKHIPQELKDKNFEKYRRNNILKRKKALKNNISRKLHKLTTEEQTQKHQLQQWFDNVSRKIEQHPYCLECELNGIHTHIPPSQYRNASAHILPKRDEYGFPSVATHPENFMGALGTTCGCHYKYDRSWDDASKMKVWPIAIDKIKKMLPFIAASEIKNLPDIIRQELGL